MTSMVYGISPYDIVTLAGAVLFVLTIAAIGAFVPAHRATTLDPLGALRCE
jgi:ABC-type antimicrobial peptide transport system permease subunit